MQRLNKRRQVLVGNAGNAGGEQPRYYAFPTLVQRRDGTILIAYKNGVKHMLDPEASLDTLILDPASGAIVSRQTVDRTPGWIHQNPELVRMPDGSLFLYDDIQKPGRTKARTGLRVYRSTDEGATFRDEGWFPQVGEFGIGYTFDDAVMESSGSPEDGTRSVVMLAMSFPELAGGRRAVHAVRTDDYGRSWTFIRNLNEEFSFAFNESSLLPFAEGFVIVARGDDQTTRAYRTDHAFRRIAERDLSAQHESIDYIGRPKLFVRDGQTFLLCRNIAKGEKAGTLRLYRFDPATLAVGASVQLDENEYAAGHSYYAECFMTESAGRPMFHVITYVPTAVADMPDIVWLSYDWRELTEAFG